MAAATHWTVSLFIHRTGGWMYSVAEDGYDDASNEERQALRDRIQSKIDRERFAPGTPFNKPIVIQFSRDYRFRKVS